MLTSFSHSPGSAGAPPASKMNTVQDTKIESEVLSVRHQGGYLQLRHLSIIQLTGKDAESFLQGRTSNDVKAIPVGGGQLSSLLDRKGSLIAFCSVHRINQEKFWIISDESQSKTILQQFQTYHFREQITYEEIADKFEALALQGPASEPMLASLCELPASEEYSISERTIDMCPLVICRRTLCGDAGFVVYCEKQKWNTFFSLMQKKATDFGISPISEDTLDTLRIEAGQPIFGMDMTEENLLPETGLEQYAASYNKGCFQGQEVLARIKTYGAPRRALVGLIFDESPTEKFKLNTEFQISGEESGCIKSNVYSPSLQHFIALAYIARDYRVPDRKVTIDTNAGKFNVTVKFLPFYSAGTSKVRARKIFDEALQVFAHGSEEHAVHLLRQAIELDPLQIDAYESLGVILSRHEQYDEAIALMHKLQSLDPESVMAHTNLSVYYMQLGDKERAEEEKAIAMSIRMTKLAREHAQQKKEAENKEKQLEEAEKRLAMFRQVLQIDPNDFLANNGIGTVYVELGRFEEAVPFLLKTIQEKPTHTVAYLALGKAFEELNRIDDAIKIYRSGIDVAAKRGDITPMKEMQTHLAMAEAKA